MDIELSINEAAAFQRYLNDRFGPLGDHFGLPEAHTPLVAHDHVSLPHNEGYTFLVASWRLDNGQMVAQWYEKKEKRS